MKKPRKHKRIATLNAEEDHAWVFAFNFYNERGNTKMKSDELAWRDMLIEFPRLRFYQGCR